MDLSYKERTHEESFIKLFIRRGSECYVTFPASINQPENKSIDQTERNRWILQVTDTNDNAPTFQNTAYSFDVPENMPRGSRIGQVVATDADADGPNSQLSYTLISDWANDVFSLNPSTGVFTLTASLDYEQVRTVQALVDRPGTAI